MGRGWAGRCFDRRTSDDSLLASGMWGNPKLGKLGEG